MTTQVRFWGVRGSIASPGPETAQVGGNTSCVEVSSGETTLILDAGTGIRKLGDALMREGRARELTLLLSHLHWDHIQGLPFFVPAYLPTTHLEVVGATWSEMPVSRVLEHQMTAPVFPVRLDELPASITTREMRNGETIQIGPALVRARKLNHPGGVLGFRIEMDGCTVVYATDTEHYACIDPALVALAKGADMLIYDAQYTPEEYRGESGPSKVGWGHSTWEVACQVARAADVGNLQLFHHDPRRSDEEVGEIERKARTLFERTWAAREGSCIELGNLARAA
jgi:phosphoribosyl 1,2-cyclic phosphodiesterase